MILRNERTGAEQAVMLGDILYAHVDRDTKLDQRKTWSFRCQGYVVTPNQNYILGPGDMVFRLGYDCFTTTTEARNFGNKPTKDQFSLVKLSEEERIKV